MIGIRNPSSVPIMVCSLSALFFPLSEHAGWWEQGLAVAGPCIVFAAGLWLLRHRRRDLFIALAVFAVLQVAAWAALHLLHSQSVAGSASWGLWLYVVALVLLIWKNTGMLAALELDSPIGNRVMALLVPGLFGASLLFIWEMVVVGFGVPRVLLPAPSAIGEVFAASTSTLRADFYQTFIRAVIPGYVIGNCTGFFVAIMADRVPFLQRGLLPLGNLISAIPIVGIAPIMVMWFGFDWQSKAAVVVIMTFFPMLVNTITGLAQAGAMERDLMRSYAAHYWQELFHLRLPNALPFVFNALKINSTLALIGAIVAEFFGTPIVGMGFRISTEVGRMNIDMVWATIAVAALVGSVFYGSLALLERWFTFWHPSFHKRR